MGFSLRRLPRPLQIALLVSLVLCLASSWLFAHKKCDMEPMLMPLFAWTVNRLNEVGLEWWIDYGTLLGSVREGRLLAHEFDLDLGAREESCPEIVSRIRPLAQAEGLPSYVPGEWIAAKHNALLGYSGYLHKSCLRIYDKQHQYYIDWDWYRTYTPEQVLATQVAVALRDGKTPMVAPESVAHVTLPQHWQLPTKPGGLTLPEGWDPRTATGRLLCNEEAMSSDGDPGGCRLEEWLLPLQAGTMRGLDVYLPANPEENLRQMYGDDWRIPKGKGYKRALCLWFPRDVLGLWLLLLFLLLAPAGAVLAWQKLALWYKRRRGIRPYQLVGQRSPISMLP